MATIQDKLDIITAGDNYITGSLLRKSFDLTGAVYKWLETNTIGEANKRSKFFAYTWNDSYNVEGQTVTEEYDIAGAPKASDGTPYMRVTEKTVGKMMQMLGFEFTAVANDTTDYEVKWTEDIEFVGAVAKCDRSDKGDTVGMSIVDVDNILGYGAGFIVTEFGKDIPGKMIEAKCDANTTTAATILAGLYIRIRYVNTSTTDVVEIAGSLRYYH
jgi:hypothetical protein